MCNSVRLEGRSLIAGERSSHGSEMFHACHPPSGSALEPAYFSARPEDVERAVAAASSAADFLAGTRGVQRGALLRNIADRLDDASAELVARAHQETALPVARLTGEVARTSGQLRLFASVVEEGSWVNARIDTADPARTPPRPDVRSMQRPLGPVVVFGASNFPLAFSVAGGDTASALAAGNPVLVKAHPAHPGTSELAGAIIAEAVQACGFPAGTFSLLFDKGHAVGAALVQHPQVRAVGFTGSFAGGRALMDLAARRAEPIPVYAEMGSSNPVFVLPAALRERGEALASGLHGSFTLGAGQFCTKPGLVFAEAQHAEKFTEALRQHTSGSPAFTMLTEGIASAFQRAVSARTHLAATHGAAASEGFAARATLLETTVKDFLAQHELAEEVFGPTTLLIACSGRGPMLEAARTLKGHLTATVLGTEKDLEEYADLLRILETRVGRIVVNAFPTGVEVNHAMVHGGPYPATSDGHSTSVGSLAIFRFARQVAYQGLPQTALLPELQDSNPLRIQRLWNGSWQAGAE